MPLKDAVGALLRGEFKWCPGRRTRKEEAIIIPRVKECRQCRHPLGMYSIEANHSQCGSVSERGRVQHSLLDRPVTDAVESYIAQNPELDFNISYPRSMACPRSRIEDIYFTCGHCGGIIGFDRHEWYWTRHSDRIAEIALPASESVTNDPHWCYSKLKDFCR